MGALDDAIREHLELKRQHGASEEEIQEAEAEALGPARREPTSVPGETPGLAEPELPAEPAPAAGTEAVGDVPPPPPLPAAVDEPAVHEPPEPDPFEQRPAAEAPAPAPSGLDHDPLEPHPVEPPPEPRADAEERPADEPPPADDPLEPHRLEPVDEHPGDPDRTRTAILDDPFDTSPPPPIHREPGPDEPPAPARPPARPPVEPEPGQEPGPPPAAAGDEEDVLEETPDFLQETPEHDRLWFEQKPPRDFDFDD